MQSKGFTLIEIMIVVAILGIITAIAYPSYIEQVRKGNRSEAKTALLGLAQKMERCFTQYNAYDNANCPTSAQTTENGFYQLTVSTTSTTYTLTAEATGGQAGDTDCKKLTINQARAQGALDGDGNAATVDCW